MSRRLHVDLVKNEWGAGLQIRQAKVVIERAREHTVTTIAQKLRDAYPGGDYVFFTELHDDSDCPFARHDMLPMRGHIFPL